nr:hypothetical protein [Bradyrhizobium ivorense]
MNTCALLMPKPEPGHREPLPEIVGARQLTIIKTRELAGFSEVALQAAASGAEKEAPWAKNTASRSRAYRRRAASIVG